MVDVVIQQRRQQIVGCPDGVKVAGKMQIDVFHRHHLRIAATGGAALHAEARAERGFAQTNYGAMARAIECIAQSHGGGGFAFARRGGANGRDQH